MININGIIVKTREELETMISNMSEDNKQNLRNEFDNSTTVVEQTVQQKDFNKYMKRASVKDLIIAEMASENMDRVRRGIWTVTDLISLTQDPSLKLVLDDINTLSFELAISKLNGIMHKCITNDIKTAWTLKLQLHLYNNG